MKNFLFIMSCFVLSLNFVQAEIPYDSAPISVEMQTYPLREIIIFNVVNKSRTTQMVMLTPGNSMSIPGAQSTRFTLAIGEEKSVTLKLGSIEGVPLPLIVDYRVSYIREESKSLFSLHNPIQFFVKNRAGDFTLADARTMMAFQEPTLARDERAEAGRLDLGAGVKVGTTLENLAFPSYEATQEEENGPIEVIRADLPKIFSERLAINSLPTNIQISTRPMPNPRPINYQVNALEKIFMEKGSSCDPLGLLSCYMGKLRIVDIKKSGVSPASWGWTVELWATKTIFGAKISYLAASTETDGAGEWTIRIPKKDAPLFAKAIFKPMNRFSAVVSPSTLKPYQFQDNVVRDIYKKTFFKGSTVGSIANIFHYANSLWIRLTNGKINPLSPTGQYSIAFPNTLLINGKDSPCRTKDGDGNIIAWSCALNDPQGAIYLIPGHDDLETVVHELGHKIHKLFWGQFPPGTGGKHSVFLCYTKGLAITEGFGDFLAAWMNSKSRDDVAGFFSGINVETFRNGACFTAQNELAVVGMFWDLYDTQQETSLGDAMSDQVSFYSDTNVIADFLGNGVQSGAPAYLESLKARQPQADPFLLRGLWNLNNVLF